MDIAHVTLRSRELTARYAQVCEHSSTVMGTGRTTILISANPLMPCYHHVKGATANNARYSRLMLDLQLHMNALSLSLANIQHSTTRISHLLYFLLFR